MRPLLPLLLVAALSFVDGAAAADPAARVELHTFRSFTVPDAELLSGRGMQDTPVTLVGELNVPLSAEGKVPAVVLLHGSAGVLPYVTEWRDELAAMGVAAFIVDSFTPRGLAGTIPDQDRLPRLNAVMDAYRALELLAKNPAIDPRRIVVMGFSRGADAALYSALRRLRDWYAPPGVGFAAHVAFYPNCGTRYRDDTDVASVPILMFHGTADDYAPAEPCRAYAERLVKAGRDVRRREYAGAGHVFMWKDLEPDTPLPTGQTTRACELAERDDGVVVNVRTGRPFDHRDACVERGAHVGYDAAAAQAARAEVKALIGRLAQPDAAQATK